MAAGYHPIGGELDPWPTLRRLEAAGARIVLPVAESRHSPLVFRAYRAGDPLQTDAAKIAAPTADAEALTPDIVITPLLAFDRHGYRLATTTARFRRCEPRARCGRSAWPTPDRRSMLFLAMRMTNRWTPFSPKAAIMCSNGKV